MITTNSKPAQPDTRLPKEPAIKTYTANISQGSTTAPVENTVFHNTVGTITWSRTNIGTYKITTNKTFPRFQTAVIIYNGGANNGARITNGYISDTEWAIYSYDTTPTLTDGIIANCIIEIRIYDPNNFNNQ